MTYASLYRAKAVAVRSNSIDAYVPQVFGETVITITDSLGELPTAPGMGWVFFQAGDPDFPVWAGALAAAGDGGTGDVGPPGPPGATGATGATGAAGVGVPVGGSAGQSLTKVDGTNYNTTWTTVTGGGSGSADNEVHIGPSAPTTGAMELWYDTDAVSTPITPLVVKHTQPTAADYGLTTIPVGAVWIQSP